ncbi:hypothetical protein cpu_16950 [Carboxydothermus pertinax]|uniref:Putative amidase domain-containing protein n=1 Tax=Carboxydothermus pertinax TaxID=870242 RepID=A0A1L8CW59_9THEO|nr:hypothetical protein cpu_16950 [Carboxydothermus pertinax]
MKTKTIKYINLVIIILLSLMINFYITDRVYATYNYTGAVSYADLHVFNPNLIDYPHFTSDCTNFVSQCIHDPKGGNKPFDEAGISQDYMWYCKQYFTDIIYWV